MKIVFVGKYTADIILHENIRVSEGLKVHKHDNFLGSDFELSAFL